MYRYVAIDLDGTLLNSEHRVSQTNIDVIKQIQKQGIVVILCSGRNISQMNFVADKIDTNKYNTYIVSDNGGVITQIDKQKRSILKNNKFENAEHKQIMNDMIGQTKYILSFNDGKRYMPKLYMREMIRAYKRFGEISKIGIPSEASKILMIDSVENIENKYESIRQQLAKQYPHLNVFRSVRTLIEITPAGSTKGSALQHIFEVNQWDLNKLLVIGDGENDLSMFDVAGKSVAMENGFDTLKAKADETTPSNDQDGVSQCLTKYFINNKK